MEGWADLARERARDLRVGSPFAFWQFDPEEMGG